MSFFALALIYTSELATAQTSYSCGGQDATIVGTSDDDVLVGTSGPDVFYTLDGNDTVTGLGGDDIICTGNGNDTVKSGPGDDIIYAGNGDDTIEAGTGNDTVFAHSGDDTVTGQGGEDIIYGGFGNDSILGGVGDDLIYGQVDDDSVDGQSGNDIIHGGNGNDSLVGGLGNDTLYGNSGDDLLNGTRGVNTLIGAHGLDTLTGGLDVDDSCHIFTIDTEKDEGDVVSQCEFGSANNFQPTPTPTLTPTASPTDVTTTPTSSATPEPTVTPTVTPADPQEAEKPRVILYAMLDDADYYDVGFLHEDGITDAFTPNIDAVAESGIALDNFYSGAAVCSPTRASVITGNNPMRYGMNSVWSSINNPIPDDFQLHKGFGHNGLPADTQSIADIRTQGYLTGHFGKWHLGNSNIAHTPDKFGFDHYVVSKGIFPVDESGIAIKVDQYENDWPEDIRFKMEENGVVELVEDVWRPAYLADEIIEYIDENKDSSDLFINWWSLVPHKPINIPLDFEQNYDNETLGFDLTTNRGQKLAMMYDWDYHFGRVIDHLKDVGLYDDSLVMLTSDNGGVGSSSNNPDVSTILMTEDRELSGYKGLLSEGGIRVPFAASWPNQIDAGSISSALSTTSDLLPTLFSLTGKELTQTVDGVDISQALLDADSSVRDDNDFIYWQNRYALYARNPVRFDAVDGDGILDDSYALRSGCYKILKNPNSTEFELYNLCSDIGESVDLATSQDPEIIATFNRLKLVIEEQRRVVSELPLLDDGVTSTSTASTLPFDQRYNTSNQDLSFYATIDSGQISGDKNILSREGALDISITEGSTSHTVTASITGTEKLEPIDPSVSPRPAAPIVTRTLSADIPNDGQEHQIGFVIRGYRVDFAEIELYIDGELQDSAYRENSLLAVYSTRVDLELGDNDLELSDIKHFLTALLPEEL